MRITHNRKYYVLTGIIVFTLLIVSISVYIIMPRGRPLEIKKTDELFGIIKDGDIICRLGNRLWSQLFSDLSETDKRYSHMGIIRIHNGLVTVIHTEGDAGPGKDHVTEISLDDFLIIARATGIYRVNGIDGNVISQTALEYLGTPFDWQFDLNNDSKLYCTELIYVVLKRIMPEIKLNTVYVEKFGKEIIPLEAISNSEYFSEIYCINSINDR